MATVAFFEVNLDGRDWIQGTRLIFWTEFVELALNLPQTVHSWEASEVLDLGSKF
jgi:hypothetical protein